MPDLQSSILQKLFTPFNFNVGTIQLSTNILQAGAVVFLIFILIVMLAQMRRRFVDWHMNGAVAGIAFGFLLALILEGLLIISGRTFLTETLGWKNAPKPISNALDAGRGKLVDVLGTTGEIPVSDASEKATIGGIMQNYEELSASEQESLRSIVCTP